MATTYQRIELCAQLATEHTEDVNATLTSLLSDEDWRVRYAAAVAIGDRCDTAFIPALLHALALEDKAPLYNQPEVEAGGHAGSTEVTAPEFPVGTTSEMREAWARRGRLKQAICLALGQIGKSSAEILDYLHRYATDSGEDYTVRAAACKALGQIRSQDSVPFLQRATGDEEWCTATEAAKALATIGA